MYPQICTICLGRLKGAIKCKVESMLPLPNGFGWLLAVLYIGIVLVTVNHSICTQHVYFESIKFMHIQKNESTKPPEIYPTICNACDEVGWNEFESDRNGSNEITLIPPAHSSVNNEKIFAVTKIHP